MLMSFPALALPRARHFAVFGLVAAFLLPSPAALGQPAADPFALNSRSSAWSVILGAGAAVRPTFEGSDRYFVSPVPLVSINYDDMVTLDTAGLSAYWRAAGLQIGGGLTYSLGRRQGGNGIFTAGDERLNGLGDIPGALGLRGYANYRLGPITLGTTFTKYLANGNDGILVDVLVEAPFRIGDKTTITGRVSTTWADQSYMQSYFGVTPLQSINSGYATFQAGSGIKDVELGINVRHQLNRFLLVSVDGRVSRLTGYAEGSPITVSNVNSRFLAMIGYRF
jgi:outer membrane protein